MKQQYESGRKWIKIALTAVLLMVVYGWYVYSCYLDYFCYYCWLEDYWNGGYECWCSNPSITH
jgi:hypothetical protein